MNIKRKQKLKEAQRVGEITFNNEELCELQRLLRNRQSLHEAHRLIEGCYLDTKEKYGKSKLLTSIWELVEDTHSKLDEYIPKWEMIHR